MSGGRQNVENDMRVLCLVIVFITPLLDVCVAGIRFADTGRTKN